MKKLNFTIRPYKKGDEISINKGFNEIFNLKRPIKEWYWKFQSADPSTSIMVAVDDENNVIAHFAATLVDIIINGKVYNCGQGVDVYALKLPGSLKFRVFNKTGIEFFKAFGGEDKIQLFVGVPNDRHFKLGQLKFNYCNALPVHVGERFVKYRRRFLKQIPDFYNCDLDAVDELWNRSVHRYPVSVVRDAKYIKRRYLDRPENRYFYLTINEGKATKVFSVFEFNKFSIKWIDLIWDGEDKKHLIAMDKLVYNITKKAGVAGNEVWISNDKEARDIFIKRGWKFSLHTDLYLTSVSFHPDLDSNKFINELYFTMGDSDLV